MKTFRGLMDFISFSVASFAHWSELQVWPEYAAGWLIETTHLEGKVR